MIRRYFSLVLLAGCLAGCSTTKNATTEPVVGNSPNEQMAVRPESFEASIGGFLGASYRIELQSDGTLQYQHNPQTFTSSPGTKSRRIKVTDDQWRDFRKSLDEANVWAWKKDYADPNVHDGTQWNLRIKYDGVSVFSHGSNAFPPKRDFERFRTAVVKLLDGLEFQ
jgi:hypothetical protein